MTLRRRGYLVEGVQPFPQWKSGPRMTDRQLKNKYGGDPGSMRLLTVLGLDPDNPPPKVEKKVCPKCEKKEVTTREVHADTGMDAMERRCRACGYSEEV